MIREDLWSEIRELSAEGLWWLIKATVRSAKRQGKLENVKGSICTLLEILSLTRKIEALENERATVNRMIGDGKR